MKTSDNYAIVLNMYHLNNDDTHGLKHLLGVVEACGWLPEYVTIYLTDNFARIDYGEDTVTSLDLSFISGFTLGLHAIGYECISGDENPMIYR